MTRKQMFQRAIKAIDRRGCLLVYPLNNRKEPASIWSELFPRTRMRWEWNTEGDTRVSDLWIVREQLSRSRQVVYSKWYQGRATFFSRDVFVAMLAFLRAASFVERLAEPASRNVLDILLADSPLSTKQLKAAVDLEGRLMESTYNRAMKPLWSRLLLVGFGEFDDSSFPSLGVGATATVFEELWNSSLEFSRDKALEFLNEKLGADSPWLKYAQRVARSSAP